MNAIKDIGVLFQHLKTDEEFQTLYAFDAFFLQRQQHWAEWVKALMEDNASVEDFAQNEKLLHYSQNAQPTPFAGVQDAVNILKSILCESIRDHTEDLNEECEEQLTTNQEIARTDFSDLFQKINPN